MITLLTNRCKAEVATAGRSMLASHKCQRRAVKDGFCKQHHPSAVKERSEASWKRYEDKRAKNPLLVALNAVAAQKAIIADLVAAGKGVLERFHEDDTRQMRRLRKAIEEATK